MNSNLPLSDKAYDALMAADTPTIANILLQLGFKNCYLHGLSPLSATQPNIVGPAFTLRFIPAREDLDSMENYGLESNIHRRAIEEVPRGSVLVIDTGSQVSSTSSASSAMGDMMAQRLVFRGIKGVVTDGGFRDVPKIRSIGLPCYQRQTAILATPIHLHPLELNVPIGCAGVAIYPGDIVVGDGNGIVIIPKGLADQVASRATEIDQYERFAEEALKTGRTLYEVFPATKASREEFAKWQEESAEKL